MTVREALLRMTTRGCASQNDNWGCSSQNDENGGTPQNDNKGGTPHNNNRGGVIPNPLLSRRASHCHTAPYFVIPNSPIVIPNGVRNLRCRR